MSNNQELDNYFDLLETIDDIYKKDEEKRRKENKLAEELTKSKEDCWYR